MSKETTAIKKEFKAACLKAASRAIKKLDRLPTYKTTARAAEDVLGGIGSMLDPWINVPKEFFKLERKLEKILYGPIDD
jgi:hypothetical protein